MNGNESSALALAAEQYGVITRAQARTHGMSDRQIVSRLAAGRLLVCDPGVYRVPGSPETNRQRAMAACLWLGDGAAVSHVTAGALLRLDRIRRPSLHLLVPRSTRRGADVEAPFKLHTATRFDRIDRVTVDGIPCTSATRTLIDSAAMLDERLEIAFESARRMGLTSVEYLAKRFTELGGRGKRGSGGIRRLLEHQRVGDQPLESPLEVKVWRLIRHSGLPRPRTPGPYPAVPRRPVVARATRDPRVRRLRGARRLPPLETRPPPRERDRSRGLPLRPCHVGRRDVATSRSSSALSRGSRSRVNRPNGTVNPWCHS